MYYHSHFTAQNWFSKIWNNLSKFIQWRIKALIQPSNSDSKFNLVSSPRLPFLSIQCLLPNNDQTFRKMKPSWRKVSLEFDFVTLASTTEFCPLMLAVCSLVPWMPYKQSENAIVWENLEGNVILMAHNSAHVFPLGSLWRLEYLSLQRYTEWTDTK